MPTLVWAQPRRPVLCPTDLNAEVIHISTATKVLITVNVRI
jgi:hypothetical protein